MNTYEPYKRWKHARNRSENPNICLNSAHTRKDKVAVYLVFQPQGLMTSTWLTLEHLNRKGYSTLLVSNSALTPEDKARALPLCWQIMQRPNFGYDFGGYQDGVIAVMESSHTIQQMLILNDSIWFPLQRQCDFLDRIETSDAGFVGAFQLEPTRDRSKMQGKKRPFMGSFFWHFKQPVLLNPVFMAFWRNYKATSSKYATIRRGERRFTHHLLDAGIVGEAMYSRLEFDRWIKKIRGPDVRQALERLCTADAALSTQRTALLARYQLDEAWETEAKYLAFLITKSQNIIATAPLYMVGDLKLPFLKKSGDEANLLALQELNVFFTNHPELIDTCVLDEIRQVLHRRSNKQPSANQSYSPEEPDANNAMMPNEK
ncbi:rhamnan synthesis F family protein [Limnohabitans sp. 2KL-17]|uniref:rhamnan synthesis F family protein n=1 Tax=Limnohabitans sp. 2KL-17 TaxID=1100704 RepID=UPI001304920D|nr:rhamnan synthesis F family protein [Limnohabitans sp. 2KL-17]